MPRTKEEMTEILTKRKIADTLKASTWADLVTGVQAATVEDRNKLVQLLVNGQTKAAGQKLKMLLVDNAKVRARTEVDAILTDDAISLAELDTLI